MSKMFILLTFIMSLASALSTLEIETNGIGLESRVIMEPSIKTFSSNYWIQDDFVVSNLDLVTATFVLKHEENMLDKLEKDLLLRSTPSSARYGQWLSKEQVIHEMSPSKRNVDAVVTFLKTFNIDDSNIKISKFHDIIRAKIPAQLAERMFNTVFARFRSESQRSVTIFRITRPYSLPQSIADIVSIVDDIIRFPAVNGPLTSFGAESRDDTASSNDPESFSSCGEKCYGYTTPRVFEKAYGLIHPSEAANGNSHCVVEFQSGVVAESAIKDLAFKCEKSITNVEVKETSEKDCDSLLCAESMMDVEYAAALTDPIPLLTWYVDDHSLLGFIDDLLSMHSPPLVTSVSYSLDSADQVSREYMDASSVQFMKVGLMGITLLFAAGDRGVWGFQGIGKGIRFHSEFPASSPYVTSVGATNFQTKSFIGPESVWTCSGGGFSEIYEQPSWQASNVQSYLSKAMEINQLPPDMFFNSKGRAYPDLTAIGGPTNPYCVSMGLDEHVGISGTSGATSVIGAVIALLNNIRLEAGKPPLGFINPLLYANPQCFKDINDFTRNNCIPGAFGGFSAIHGWDPATGLGSPVYSCLAEIVAL